MKNAMRPIHPGEILREEPAELSVSANALAGALGVPGEPYYRYYQGATCHNS